LHKPKVLILLSGLKKGGPVLGAVALAKYINKNECDVMVGCLGSSIPEYEPVIGELEKLNIGIKLFDIPGWQGFFRWKIVREYIYKEQIEILHSYGIRPDIVNSMISSHCISISSVRGMIRKEYGNKFGKTISGIFTRLHIKALQRLDHIIAISNAMKEDLISEGISPDQITHIPNFVDVENINENIKAENPATHIAESPMNIGYIGSIIRRKRVDWIIQAFSEIAKTNSLSNSIRLHIIGDGTLRSKMEKLVSDLKIDQLTRFYGYIDNVTDLMKSLDVIVLTSISEGIPRVLMEAMAHGKTVIGPAIDGVKELITHNLNGYLFDPKSYDDLVKKLKQVIQEKAFLDVPTIKSHIEKNFNAKEGAETTRTLYQKLLINRS